MPMICICSPQGGSGRSSLAVNLAGAYAHRGNKVLLIDLNVQNSLLLHFNIGDGVVQGFVPNVGNEPDWTQYIHKVGTNLYLLPYGDATFQQHNHFEFLLHQDPALVVRGLEKLNLFPGLVVIVDMPSGPHMALRQIQPLVDMHIVMLQPDGISPALLSKLEDNRFLDMPLNKNGSQYYVLNQTDSRYEMSHDIEIYFKQTLSDRLLGNIHRDSSVSAALTSQKQLREYRPSSAALFDIDSIEQKISALLDITVGENGAMLKLTGNRP